MTAGITTAATAFVTFQKMCDWDPNQGPQPCITTKIFLNKPSVDLNTAGDEFSDQMRQKTTLFKPLFVKVLDKYSKSFCSNLIYRISNAIKSIFGQSDYQKLIKQLKETIPFSEEITFKKILGCITKETPQHQHDLVRQVSSLEFNYFQLTHSNFKTANKMMPVMLAIFISAIKNKRSIQGTTKTLYKTYENLVNSDPRNNPNNKTQIAKINSKSKEECIQMIGAEYLFPELFPTTD